MPAQVATTDELDAVDERVAALEKAAPTEPSQPTQPYDDSALASAVGTLQDGQAAAGRALADLAGRVQVLEERPAGGTSTTVVGLPYTVISEPTDAAVQRGLKAWRSNFNGPFPKTRLLLGFSGEAKLTTPLEAALGDTQMQALRWEGLGKRSTVLSWARTDVPMFTAFGLLRNYVFEDFTIKSTAPRDATTGHGDAKGWYLRSNQSPKNNTDGEFHRVEWQGAWDYGLALAGDANANENSEVTFDKVALGNDASFKTAWFWSGAGGTAMQQNQFLNYSFRDTKLEHSHGDLIRMDYGGSIHCDGFNSWIATGSACPGGIGAAAAATRYIYLPRGYNFDSTMFLSLVGLRPEMRSKQVKLLDSAWSGAGGITIENINMCALASGVGAYESITLRGDCPLLLASSFMHGFIGLRGSAKPKIRLINVASSGGQGLDWDRTDGVDPAGVRKVDATASTANLRVL